MSLAASIQITDQDINQISSTRGSEKLGQLASTPSNKVFAYALNGAGTLVAGKTTEPVAVTANYATRTLTATSTPIGSTQISVPLGTTASADAFIGFQFVVTDGTGKGQGTYYITGNTAATAGNTNTTIVTISGQLNVALDNTSVVGIYPNQESAVVVHSASVAVPCVGAPIVPVTAAYYFWNQVQGSASILSDGAITKNAGAINSASVAGAAAIEATTTITQRIGYAPELTVDTKYSPLILTLAGL